jgi:hypothetical protein
MGRNAIGHNQGVVVRTRSRSAASVMLVAALAAVGGTLAACGSEPARTPDPKPATAGGYRALSDAARLAAAAGCRNRAARRAEGTAARQIAGVDEMRLLRWLDIAVADYRKGARFDRACAATLPLVTPGLRVTFSGVTGNGIVFTFPTRSDRPLTIRGTVDPAPASGSVVARRESGPEQRITAPIDERGQFVFRDLRLRKVADNTFLLTIEAPPNAPRLVRFSALCLDCIVSGSPT